MAQPGAQRQRPSVPLPRTVAGRRRLTAFLVLLTSGLAGYLTTCVAYPRPLFGKEHSVGRVIGLPLSEAERLLEGQGFKVKIEGEEPDPEIAAGSVRWQDPPPDLIVPRGTTIQLIRSAGPANVPVPDLAAFDLDQATRVLIAAGLKVGDVDTVPSAEDPGIVVGSRPDPGSAKAPGSTVDLLVSEGPSGVEVPNVIGLRQDEARRQIEAAGFRVGRVSRTDTRRGPPGTVLEQQPVAGSRASRRTRVDLVITEVN